MTLSPLETAAAKTPAPLAKRIRGLSDRTIAWIFVAPTIFPVAGCEYLSADLDHPAELYKFSGEPSQQ